MLTQIRRGRLAATKSGNAFLVTSVEMERYVAEVKGRSGFAAATHPFHGRRPPQRPAGTETSGAAPMDARTLPDVAGDAEGTTSAPPPAVVAVENVVPAPLPDRNRTTKAPKPAALPTPKKPSGVESYGAIYDAWCAAVRIDPKTIPPTVRPRYFKEFKAMVAVGLTADAIAPLLDYFKRVQAFRYKTPDFRPQPWDVVPQIAGFLSTPERLREAAVRGMSEEEKAAAARERARIERAQHLRYVYHFMTYDYDYFRTQYEADYGPLPADWIYATEKYPETIPDELQPGYQ